MTEENINILKTEFDYHDNNHDNNHGSTTITPDDYAKALLSNYIRMRDSYERQLKKYNADIKKLRGIVHGNEELDPSHINDESGFSCGGGCE